MFGSRQCAGWARDSVTGCCPLQMYKHGSMDKAGLMSAWLSKARVQHDDRDFQGAKQTAAAALAAFRSSTMPLASDADRTELSLIQSCCDLELGDTATACQGFTRMAGERACVSWAADASRRAAANIQSCLRHSGSTVPVCLAGIPLAPSSCLHRPPCRPA